MLDLRLWPALSLVPLFLGAALGHPTQQPLLFPSQNSGLPANYTSFELRRYGISSHEDLIHMIDLVHRANIDVWHLAPSHVDVHMDTTADLPLSLASRRYTTLPHSFPYNYDYHPATSSSSKSPKIDLSSLQDNEFHRNYHTYEEIDQFVVAMASRYPKLVEIVWLGASSEQRDVFAIRIGKRSRAGGKKGKKGKKHKKKKHTAWETYPFVEIVHHYARNLISRLAELGELIPRGRATTMRDLYPNPRFDAITQSRPIKDRMVIQGAQHAREWIASAAALYVAHALVTPEGEPGSLQHLLNKFDFTIIPVPNPDGYAYTWSTDRLWYKNRMQLQPNAATSDECRGVDMNRNWGYQWNVSDHGLSGDPCSHWYPGAYPFQAPEVTAIANYIRRTPKIRGFLDLRSYGQQLMYPYSYSCEHVAPHAENLIEAAIGATKALRETHGVPYTSGASCELLYPAPGNIIDWTYEEAGVKYSYSLMLRDTGTYGFLLPPRYIQPVGEETAAAVNSLTKFIEDVVQAMMASELSDDVLNLIIQMEDINRKLSQDGARSDDQNEAQAAVLRQLAKLAADRKQRRENETVRKSIIWMWRSVKANIQATDSYIAVDPVWSYICSLARFTGNLAVQCPSNQTWIVRECEPHIRWILHFLTSWYYTEEVFDRSMVRSMTRCLSNIITGNEETSKVIWTTYTKLAEKDNIVTRLLQYPDLQTMTAALVFILNSLSTNPSQSLAMATGPGGRAICVSLLERAERIHEDGDEEMDDSFQLIFNIFVKLFEDGGLAPLYQGLHSSDETISPHQITLLKLLDGYIDVKPRASELSPSLSDFLCNNLSALLQNTKSWTSMDADSETEFAPNENLPLASAATVLVSQMLSNLLMAEQTAWEISIDKENPGRPILGTLRSTSSTFVELIIDVLRRLDQLLPRIQFGKAKPIVTETNAPPGDKASLPASRFQFQKRDLVRLLGILIHDEPSIQTRVREAGGVQLILGLCAIDESNPFIREHALFTLRNLLYKSPENQRIVQEMEPMGRIDENGILVGI
ncbi:unnamed protein product [Rhizoctonia solani]|uniref:tubulin-glutamate carboxypeptidase n=1 Tax=Rhizoctonia solani TaxID=456999 RepID=A0A8H3AYY2_9AGAM|nr:unnamed protein product [Rhizoctonia solani]